MRGATLAIGFGLLIATVAVAAEVELHSKSFIGEKPPHVSAPDENWLNSKRAPRAKDLEGKVVWLEFSFSTWATCIKLTPNLVRWDKKYRGQGLRVLEISNGCMDSKKTLSAAVTRKQQTYPVLWDEEAYYCDDVFEVKSYPTGYLIGVDGKVLWEGIPYPHMATIEELIKAELAKIKKGKGPEEGTGDSSKPTTRARTK